MMVQKNRVGDFMPYSTIMISTKLLMERMEHMLMEHIVRCFLKLDREEAILARLFSVHLLVVVMVMVGIYIMIW